MIHPMKRTVPVDGNNVMGSRPPLRRAAVRTDQIAQPRTRLSNGRIDGRLGNVGYSRQPVRFDGARRIPIRIQGGPAPCPRSWT